MRTPATIISKSLWTLLLLALFPVTGLAHTLEAPDTVHAAADGSFSYEAVFTAGPGSATVAAFTTQPLQNVLGGGVSDCFCTPGCLFDEGESESFPVWGSLIDLTQQGVVRISVSFCNEPEIETITIILLGPVPVEGSTWGAIKALYAIESLYKWR